MQAANEITLDTPATPFNADEQIQKLINNNDLLVFMKGNMLLPQCGFSAQVMEILKRLNATFSTFDILQDDIVRNEIKKFSKWPTIPQIYYKQKFVGGCDIVTEMFQNGELDKLLS